MLQLIDLQAWCEGTWSSRLQLTILALTRVLFHPYLPKQDASDY